MDLYKLTDNNAHQIAHLMDNGVSYEELDAMLADDELKDRNRYFVRAGGHWAFIEEADLEALMLSLLNIIDK